MTGSELASCLREKLKALNLRIETYERAGDEEEGLREVNGTLYLTGQRLTLRCDAALPGAADLLSLALSLSDELREPDTEPDSIERTYRLILKGQLPAAEFERLQRLYHLREHQNRCVLIFRAPDQYAERLLAQLEEIAPLDIGDVLMPWQRGQALLIKAAGRTAPEEDLLQYAEALQETWLGETGYPLRTGIGTVTQALARLGQSAEEGEKALDIGSLFHPEQSVYEYRKLLLERFLNDIPQQIRDEYQAVLFNKATARLFDEEMLGTLEMFFGKDLNVSDAARQLYIHRNTLMYRLDKVQRATGLDLRKFEDAVIFKLLMDLKRCGDYTKGGK